MVIIEDIDYYNDIVQQYNVTEEYYGYKKYFTS